jgi:hypothetical protein
MCWGVEKIFTSSGLDARLRCVSFMLQPLYPWQEKVRAAMVWAEKSLASARNKAPRRTDWALPVPSVSSHDYTRTFYSSLKVYRGCTATQIPAEPDRDLRESSELHSALPAETESALTSSVVWWSEFLATDPEVRVQFPALPDFLRSSGSGTGSTQSREYSRGVNGVICEAEK